MSVLTAAAAVLGTGGYRGGAVITTVGLALVSGGAVAATLRPLGRRAWPWIIAAALLGSTVGGVLVDRAPMSKGVIAQRMDRIDLPFFHLTDEKATGHSWCRPSCPAVERRFRGPNTSDRATMIAVVLGLQRADLVDDARVLTRIGEVRYLRLSKGKFLCEVRIAAFRPAARDVVITCRSLKAS